MTPGSEHCLPFSSALVISFLCQITTLSCGLILIFPKTPSQPLPLQPCHKLWSGTQAAPCKLTNWFFSFRSDTHFSVFFFFFYSVWRLYLICIIFTWSAGLSPQISVMWNTIVSHLCLILQKAIKHTSHSIVTKMRLYYVCLPCGWLPLLSVLFEHILFVIHISRVFQRGKLLPVVP